MIGKLVSPRTDQEFILDESPTTIGRHEGNMIRLRGFAISRFHVEIGEIRPGKAYIEDMGSTYGTYVNGRKIDGRVSLHDGAQILLGVSSGFPKGEYAFVFHKAAGSATSSGQHKRTPTRHRINEGLVSLDKEPGAYVAHLNGVFRRNECDSLATEVLKLVRATPKDVILELGRVEYMNSYGMGTIVRLTQDVEAEDKRLVLAGAEGLILKLFKTVGLDRRLQLFATEREAIDALAEQE